MTEAGARSSRTWSFIDSWVGRATAILGLIATLAGGVTWWVTRHRERAARQAQIVLAEAQAGQAQYGLAWQTFASLLRADPLDRAALDGQLKVTMLWTENYSVVVPDGTSASAVASPELDDIMETLESGLTRAQGSEAADVQAHLGWAHWLNQRVAAREFGTAAAEDLRGALARDPRNVYANAMLGNWMLQNEGDPGAAVEHFDTAVATGRARPFVRQMQIGGLLSCDDPGCRAALMKAASQMRTAGEPLDPDVRRRVVDFCCDPTLARHEEIAEFLSAVGPDDAWNTYLWLDDRSREGLDLRMDVLMRSFIQANLLEASGQTPAALARYRQLQAQLAHQPGSLKDSVDEAVVRLARRS